MIISHLSKAVRYTGRWSKEKNAAITTTPGAMFEMAFQGKECVLLFDVNMNMEPFPHIYIQVDDNARIESRLEQYIRVEATESGNHIVRVIFKSAMEMQPRWNQPLIGKVTFVGAEAELEGELPNDERKIIEFIGDSITEGIWVDEFRQPFKFGQKNMVFQNDSTATYAYLTAEALGMKAHIMGYGAVGLTKAGNGGVPKVYDAYLYNYDGSPASPSGAEIIVINHGANDAYATVEKYLEEYERFLELVRKMNPSSKIVVLSAFCGAFHVELGKMIQEYNRSRSESIIYIDSFGWIPAEPLHPLRDGHKIVAKYLVEALTSFKSQLL